MKKAKIAKIVSPEWSHKIDADDIGLTPLSKSISASPQERKDLARRLFVDSVESVEAQLTLERDPQNLILHVCGHLKAKITQPCVVSLEPIQQDIKADVEGWFADPEKFVSITRARHEKKSRKSDAELEILEEKDDPEPILDGEVDIGELVAQKLSVTINPYPHKDGVVFEQSDEDKKGQEASKIRQNPFAALKNWKKGADNEN